MIKVDYYRFLSKNDRLWEEIGMEMLTSGKFGFVIYEFL